MSRVIKFRALLRVRARASGDYTKFVTEFTLEDVLRGKVVFTFPEHWIFQQFTGLTDKNGKEIFEGDIVKYVKVVGYKFGELGYVEWATDNDGFWIMAPEGALGINNRPITGYGPLAYSDSLEMSNALEEGKAPWLEVVGDVYQNPELLKI